MTVDMVIDALGLPPESRVDQRIAKKLLVENGAPTAADRKAINDGIEELSWIAELKSSNCGVPVYKDKEREYIEIALLALSFRGVTKVGDTKVGRASQSRIIELVHRAIPYPVFLIAWQADQIMLSLAAKRWAQNEGGRVVLDGEPVFVQYEDRPWSGAFLSGLSLGSQERRDFRSLYRSWAEKLVLYNASMISSAFLTSSTERNIDEISQAIDEYQRIGRELASLRAAASVESQLNRRVELNMEIKKLEKEQKTIKAKLK